MAFRIAVCGSVVRYYKRKLRTEHSHLSENTLTPHLFTGYRLTKDMQILCPYFRTKKVYFQLKCPKIVADKTDVIKDFFSPPENIG